MSKFSIDDLYRFLRPGYDKQRKPGETTPEKFREKVGRLLINENGVAQTWSQLATKISQAVTSPNPTPQDAQDIKEVNKYYRFLGPSTSNPSQIDKLKDESYYGKVKSTNDVYSSVKKTSVIAIRDPQVTPASQGCDKIGRFLNFTPSFVASQMIPYLDVEFQYEGTSKYTKVPSPLRFTLGVKNEEGLSPQDKALHLGSQVTGKRNYTRTGMELFLMPQSLTNMETLGVTESNRLVPVKPFMPIASLDGFDVTVRNAGAGSFAHKTANLKLKIHDKSRVSEMGEFIRGGDGFRRVTIVTRYGWRAPVTPNPGDNEFFEYINKEMVREDVWSIVNSQFSFDSTGQVNVGLSLVSAAVRYMGQTDVVMPDESPAVNKFNEKVQKVNEFVDKINAKGRFPTNVMVAKVLRDASMTGIYSEKNSSKVSSSIKEFIASLKSLREKGTPVFEQASEETEFERILEELNKGTNKKSLYEQSQSGAQQIVDKKFKELTNTKTDPWLPKSNSYFNPDLVKEVQRKNGNVVSFAKLMLVFGGGLESDADEVQLVFYPINTNAGYAGRGTNQPEGISIAEYPIDVELLKLSYYARIKELNTVVLSLEDFFKLVIDQNMSDARGLGFGKSSYYTKFESDKSKEPAKVAKGQDAGVKSWEEKNPSFVVPILEMVAKTEQAEVDGQRKNIKRIYIYDKQSAPYAEDYDNMTIEDKKSSLEKGVPLIKIGTNGSLIMNSSVASKTDGTQQAVYLARSLQSSPDSKGNAPEMSPAADPANKLPMRTLPVQLTMTSLGCPTAMLYQQFFVDFETGTSLDNLYMCTQIQHSLTPGKFTTAWTFMQSNGYAKFAPPKVPNAPGPAKVVSSKAEKGQKAKKSPEPAPAAAPQPTAGPSR